MIKIFVSLILLFSFVGCDNDSPSVNTCGDGVTDPGEDCDGDSLPAGGCEGQGYYGGTLSCNSNCTLNLISCEEAGTCGDGILHKSFGEECDGSELDGAFCAQFQGYYGGALRCNDQCEYEFSDCERCGDGVVQEEEGEECDGDVTETCEDLGHYAGILSCASDCKFDTSNCGGNCGDGNLNTGEECDGSEFAVSCFDGNYWGCTLSCETDCTATISNGFNSLMFGSSENDIPAGVTIDIDGNIIITGKTDGTYEGMSGIGSSDIFITKLTATGGLIWHKIIGSQGWQVSTSVAADSDGSIYLSVSGNTQLENCYGGSVEPRETDALLLKYDNGGNFIWCKSISYPLNDYGRKVVAGPGDIIYFIYEVEENGPVITHTDINIRAYTKNGGDAYPYPTQKSFGTDSTDQIHDLIIDPMGNAYFAGKTGGAFPGYTEDQYYNDAFVIKLDPSGNTLWIRQFGATGANDSACSLALAANGNVLVAGFTSGAAVGEIIGGGDIFVAELDNSTGVILGGNQFGTSGYDDIPVIRTLSTGEIYLFASGRSIGSLPGFGGDDFWGLILDQGLNITRERMYGTIEHDSLNDVVVDTQDNVFIVGSTRGSWDGIFNSGLRDVFITRDLQ